MPNEIVPRVAGRLRIIGGDVERNLRRALDASDANLLPVEVVKDDRVIGYILSRDAMRHAKDGPT